MGGATILLFSDVHCASGLIRRLAGAVSYDIAMCAGDFECVDVVEEFLSLDGDLVAVTGNLDNASIYRRLSEAGVLADGRVVRVGRFVVAGVGGLDVATSLRMLGSRVSRDVDVLLSHHPPKGILDLTVVGVRAGLPEIRRLVEGLEPLVHAFGHIHESPGVEVLGRTTLVNPGPLMQGRYAILRISSSGVEAELARL